MRVSAHPLRSANLRDLAHERFDVVVIGGGIVGSGIARDAAMRGLRTGLIDRHDFAFGTSSRSSRLLHGGLRYLEQGRISLVRAASREKKTLHHIAPHLTQPLGFVFPAYRPDGRPLWQLRIGVGLYDLLCSGRNFERSRGYTSEEARELLPGVEPGGLRGAVRYFDALTNDARLVLDTLRSAVRHGATVANYVPFHSARRTGDAHASEWICLASDSLSGEPLTLRTRTVVNATGPWAEGLGPSAVKLRLSKGVHLVFDRSRLPVTDAVVMTEGKRLLFVLPWGRRIIVGTTDTDYAGAPEDVAVAAADVAYVLRAVNRAFPRARLAADEVISSWAGVRPLIANADGTPSDISRAHQIRSPEPGWWDVTGGKLTTYRLMAEETVNHLVRHLGVHADRCRSATEPLLPVTETRFSGIVPEPFSPQAVDHYVQTEWCHSLEDLMVRRSGWHHYLPETERRQVAAGAADRMAHLLAWSPAQRRDAEASYHHGANFRMPP